MHRLEEGGVLVHGERVTHLLTGTVYEALVAQLDGRWSRDAIVRRLASEHDPASVYYALMQLESLRFVTEAPAAFAPAAAFWAELGDPGVRSSSEWLRVDLQVLSDGGTSIWRRDLEAVGIGCDAGAELSLVVTSSYLDERLAAVSRRAVAEGRRWVLCRLDGTVWWMGPHFGSPGSACWACLQQRLHRNQPVEAWLEARHPHRARPVAPAPWTRRTAVGLLATQLARLVSSAAPSPLLGALITFDSLTLEARRHPVSRRPQCDACGDPSLYAARLGRPIELRPVARSAVADAGYRSLPPGETVARWTSLIDSLTGVVSALERVDAGSPHVHVYAAGANLAQPQDSWRNVKASLRRSAGGKGLSDAQARASALGEAVERYSGRFQGDEPRVSATLRSLGDAALHPNDIMLFSRHQLEARALAGGGMWGLDWIPLPFDEDRFLEWTPVWSLSEQRAKYLPTGLLYLRYHTSRETATTIGDSNGNAAGNTIEEAILQGFLELVERDSAALWWYNRLRRPPIDLDSIGTGWLPELRREYERRSRELWVLDLTSDLGIPVFAAVSRRVDAGPEAILVGLGAHLDAQVAATRALTELNQMLASVEAPEVGQSAREGVSSWLLEARLSEQAYLAPSTELPRSLRTFAHPEVRDLGDAVTWCQALVHRHGLEMLVLDQTRPDVEIPVVKVIVPGLRHFRARFAPGRLYDVPVALGWIAQPVPEREMNPIPFFL
jgi:bacteriocin biosynthesis cyclodehydratase domain-containing protein